MSLPDHPLLLPQPGRYRHYSGSLHDVVVLAAHAHTRRWLVICRPSPTFTTTCEAIPVEDWNTSVRIDGKTVPRFVKVVELDGELWP